jgi:hypothetical protein
MRLTKSKAAKELILAEANVASGARVCEVATTFGKCFDRSRRSWEDRVSLGSRRADSGQKRSNGQLLAPLDRRGTQALDFNRQSIRATPPEPALSFSLLARATNSARLTRRLSRVHNLSAEKCVSAKISRPGPMQSRAQNPIFSRNACALTPGRWTLPRP